MKLSRVFISNANTQLGRQLIELFRNDHMGNGQSNQIFGTSSPASPQYQHPSYKCLNFSLNPNLVIKTAVESDTVVLDLVECPAESELIIRYIGEGRLTKLPKVIAISSFMTWANTPGTPSEGEDLVDLLKSSTENLRPIELFENQFQKRKPAHANRYSYSLQNYILHLRQTIGLPACIISSGLVYGKSYDYLLPYFERTLLAKQQLSCEQTCRNLVPICHIDSLVQLITTISNLILKGTPIQPFYFACDESIPQETLLESIQSGIFKKPLLKNTTINQSQCRGMLMLNIICKSNTLHQKRKLEKRRILQEFLSYRDLTFNWVEVSKEDPEAKTIVEKMVSKGYKLVDTSKIHETIEMIEKGTAEAKELKQEMDRQRKEFEQKNAPVGKKKVQEKDKPVFSYSLKIINGVTNYIAQQHQFENTVAILQNGLDCANKPTHQKVIKITSDQQRSAPFIYYKSQAFLKLLNQLPQKEENQEPQPTLNPQKQVRGAQDEPAQKQVQNLQVTNMKQYLVDNIMPTITEAVVRVQRSRPEQIMIGFLNSLREIEQQRRSFFSSNNKALKKLLK